MEEDYVFLDRHRENDKFYVVICETHKQGREYLINEKKMKNPKLESIEKIKREKRISYPHLDLKGEAFHEK